MKKDDPPSKKILLKKAALTLLRLAIGIPTIMFLAAHWREPEIRDTFPTPMHVGDLFLIAWIGLPILSWLWDILSGNWKKRAKKIDSLKGARSTMTENAYNQAINDEFAKQNVIDKIGIPLRFALISIVKSLAIMMLGTATYLWILDPEYAKQTPSLTTPVFVIAIILPGFWIASKIFQYAKWHLKFVFKSAHQKRTENRVKTELDTEAEWKKKNDIIKMEISGLN